MNRALMQALTDAINAHATGKETPQELMAIVQTVNYFSGEVVEETLDELAAKIKKEAE